ncbi:MAG: hypothetical protein ACE10D_10135 [Planctomycetota bacterium]|nr:hypothetical protein [Planctomycetota bacterium]
MGDPVLAELLQAYRRGNVARQRELLEEVEPLLYAYTRTGIGTGPRYDEEVLDLTHSLTLAFHLAACQGQVELRDASALRAYTHRMVEAKLADRVAEPTARELVWPDDELSGSLIATVSGLRHAVVRELEAQELTVFEARMRGAAHESIAAQLASTAADVRSIEERARRKLLAAGVARPPRPDAPRPK